MPALVPYNYGNFSSQINFGYHTRKKNHYYDKEFIGQRPFIPPPYPIRPYYPTAGYDQLNKQYRYEQYMLHINEMQRRFWKQQDNTMPLPTYTRSFPSYDTQDPIY